MHGYYCVLSREGDVGAWVLLCRPSEIFPLKSHFLNTNVIQGGNLIHVYVGVCG